LSWVIAMKIMPFTTTVKTTLEKISKKLIQILKGEKINQDKFFSKSFATTSFLMDDKLSSS
jgi:hypothetical protein